MVVLKAYEFGGTQIHMLKTYWQLTSPFSYGGVVVRVE